MRKVTGGNWMGKKALVVDNDFYFVEFLTEQLEERGYDVSKAYNGKEAIPKLQESEIDLVFVDTIMPDNMIGGKQLIQFIRSRFTDRAVPVVALSIVEQIEGLQGTGADYFIGKGPVEKMTPHIQALLDKLEKRPIASPNDRRVFQPENLIPRQVTDELIQAVDFQQAIIESAGIGMMVIDQDLRIILCNRHALKMLDTSYGEILNAKVMDIFPDALRSEITDSLRELSHKAPMRKTTFPIALGHRKIKLILSAFVMAAETKGWVMGLCE
jgi:CheY-like chemotaxis protein